MFDFKVMVSELFYGDPDLQILLELIQQSKLDAWLVGGTLRDMLLNREISDLDIAVSGDPTELAKNWAQRTSGRWFWLDSERCQSRVLTTSKMTVDFTPLRAPTILEDLALRDYTINSLAFPLGQDVESSDLLDPLAGQNDLQQKTLRLCSPQSLIDDPLRMLKGIRHVVLLDLTISDSTYCQIKEHASRINSVAGERIRDELGKILSSENPISGFKLLIGSGLLFQLLGASSDLFVIDDALAELSQLDQSMAELEVRLDSAPGHDDTFNSRALFMLATFLRSYSPANISALLHKTLRLSRQQERIVLSLQNGPDAQWFDRTKQQLSSRQKALLVESLGFFPDEQLLYWTVYKQHITLDIVRDLLSCFYEYQRLGRVPDLLSGHQLRELLYDEPETQIGSWQKKIKLAEVSGEINVQNDAYSWLKSKISN